MMVAALIAVVWLMRSLDAGSMAKLFDNFGLQAGGAGAPGFQVAGRPLQPGEERLNLCPTRIVSFIWSEKYGVPRHSIEERQRPGSIKMQWLAFAPAPRELSYLEIEKWLTLHCQVTARQITEKDIAHFSSRVPLAIHYVDGGAISIDEIDRQFFRIGEKFFESSDLAVALKELRIVAQMESKVVNMPVKLAPPGNP
jgi:hypothetical protein